MSTIFIVDDILTIRPLLLSLKSTESYTYPSPPVSDPIIVASFYSLQNIANDSAP
ncbi:hypothetical protein [Terrisporobacter vanillatitrophus]|uniref:hypothetical protein n=1 Tax=Terrisporobacter vanillatitrophus TaxID=3058402 RepID=UPI003EB7F2F7